MFKMVSRLNLNLKKCSVFVQTDKSIYKPADKVQFRVLVLSDQLKPFENKKVDVFITDGADNRVKQFNDVTLTKGVFQGELQLSDSPVLGKWNIYVNTGATEESTEKEFEVAEYTLPKFEVTIDANPNANLKDGKVRATVRAKYTFGKMAKGNATVTAEVESLYSWRYWDNSSKSVKVSKSVEVNGKKPIEFDILEDFQIKDVDRERTVKFHATFIEELTQREQNATAEVKIHKTPHNLQLEMSKKKFKPELPLVATAIVKTHDGAPITDTMNSIEFTIKYFYEFSVTFNQTIFNQTIETQERRDGNYEFKTKAPIKLGISTINIEFPPNTTQIDVTAKYLDTETKNHLRKSYRESSQYIQIKPLVERLVKEN